MKKIRIKEVIVVEGKDDVSAVKNAVDAEVISTSGLGLDSECLNIIKEASKNRGIIILTDPDYPGEKIRNIVSNSVDNVKHAFIRKEKTIKNGDLGIENAEGKDIIHALKNANAQIDNSPNIFSKKDMLKYNLIGGKNSSIRRRELGSLLNIGYCSAKKFLKRINSFNISRLEFEKALKIIERRGF